MVSVNFSPALLTIIQNFINDFTPTKQKHCQKILFTYKIFFWNLTHTTKKFNYLILHFVLLNIDTHYFFRCGLCSLVDYQWTPNHENYTFYSELMRWVDLYFYKCIVFSINNNSDTQFNIEYFLFIFLITIMV